MLTSPVPFIPISGLLLLQFLAGIRHQELLRGVSVGKNCNIFHSHQLLVEVVILVSAVLPVKILDVRRVGSGNALARKQGCQVQVHIGIVIK